MGRKLDLSGLTDSEAEHVLQVVQRDMRLRKKEEERLSELKQELDAEGSRCLLLSRQSCFNQRCCIRCCAPFTFLLNPKRPCRDCRYNVCKACRVYNKRDKAWLCSACQKSRLLKTQSLEWFYTNVKRRFKRFGSAKVLKTLYRKHLAEHSALSELTEGSAYEESICNEGSVCGSDSTFYRQSEEHSMAETLTVALRVAEEAIDEAIANAEFDTASQGKQNEANYLREHREELIEELAKTIVQKIITRRKTLAEMKDDYKQEWPLNKHNTDLHQQHHHQTAGNQICSPFKPHHLRRSHSAFSLLDNDSPGLIHDTHQAFKKEGSSSTMSTWKSVDRLDNAGVSSVLKSPDGNWIALQSAQLSRPSLLTKRKSLVYSALEKESGVVSAYEGMGSDNETKPERDGSGGAALQEIHGNMTDSTFTLQDNQERGHKDGTEDRFSDGEENWRLQSVDLQRKVPADWRRPSPSPRPSIIDVNFNVEGAGMENTGAAQADTGKVKRSKKRSKRRSKREPAASSPRLNDNRSHHSSDAVTSDTWTSDATQPDPSNLESDVAGEGANPMEEEPEGANQMEEEPEGASQIEEQEGANQAEEELTLKQTQGGFSDSCTRDEEVDDDARREEERRGSEGRNEEDERLWRMEIDLDDGQTDDEKEEDEEEEEIDDEMKRRLYTLIAQSRLTYLSSTDEELNRAGLSEGECDREQEEDMEEEEEEEREGPTEEKTNGLTHALCQLEEEVHASQLSSTEDELDRAGFGDEVRTGDEEEEEEELAIRVCRLVNQVSAAQFSSTEDELDRAGTGEEEDEVMLWKLQEEQAAQVRHLASLVSASQFSSTEDELQRFGEGEGEVEEGREVKQEVLENSVEVEELWRRDAEEMREDVEETNEEEDAAEGETGEAGHEDGVQEEGGTGTEGTAEDLKVAQESSEAASKAVEEIMASYEMGFTQEKQPEAKSDKKEEEEEEEEEDKGRSEDTSRRSKRSRGIWGAVTDSEEEDEEFDRIISSMLMMTLENVGEEAPKVEAATRIAKKEPEHGEDSKAGELQGRRSPSAAEEEEEGCGQRESASSEITTELGPSCDQTAAEDGTTMEAEQQMMELQEDGGSSETKDEPGQTLGPASSPRDGLLSPEEIQNDGDMDLWGTIQFLSSVLEQRYSAVSLRNITTEVLKVLNATEELLQGVEGGDGPPLSALSLPPDTDPRQLDQQFCKMEENVYVAAGAVYRLEEELSDLEECARGISSTTPDLELSFLEEQVASAAAKVQQSELQICDISARIAALKNAGLDVDPQSRFNKTRTIPVMPVTLDSSRHLRRRLPAPPVKEDKET